MQFTIFGAGSLGTILASHLSQAGYKVHVIARGERAAYIERHGLVVTGLVELVEHCSVLKKISSNLDTDVLIFAVKTYQMEESLQMARQLRPRVVFALANGVRKNEQLKATFPESKVLGCMANFSGELLDTGDVLFTRNESFNLDGLSQEGIEISKAIGGSGIVSIADEEIESTEWSKFVGWVPLFALSLITRSPIGDFLSLREFAVPALTAIREMSGLAKLKGVALHDNTVLPVLTLSGVDQEEGVDKLMKIGMEFYRSSPNHRMSALQDLENRRRLEVHETLGHAVEMARRCNLELKVLPLFYALVSGLDKMVMPR